MQKAPNSINQLPIEQVEVSERRLLLPTTFVGKLIAGNTTPSVKNVERWKAVNIAPVSVTDFLDGQDGQELLILGDGFTTLVYDSTKLVPSTAPANLLLVANAVYNFIRFDNVWYETVGGFTSGGGGGGGSSSSVDTFTITTASLASGATENGSVTLGAEIYTIESTNAWVRLYQSAAARTADSGRTLGTKATPGTGVLAEFSFTSHATIEAGPIPTLPIGSPVYYAIKNTGGGSAVITVIIVGLSL